MTLCELTPPKQADLQLESFEWWTPEDITGGRTISRHDNITIIIYMIEISLKFIKDRH